jgi:hypothetical protein
MGEEVDGIDQAVVCEAVGVVAEFHVGKTQVA